MTSRPVSEAAMEFFILIPSPLVWLKFQEKLPQKEAGQTGGDEEEWAFR